ncbi:PAS domain S-box protein [Paenibacillus sinopodophylli]|uniref:PAS domain S-box protein n=1 Tax=Paenibacillus sinopodophylli TaxID=1837342 RepID=UPI00110D247F|nr:PAS domain S-box protein [Paenibacillus sinopodophylli]
MTLISKPNREADLFTSAFHYASIGMALVDLDGRIMVANPSAHAMLGYEDSELSGLTYAQITHPDDLEQDDRYVKQLLDGFIDTYQMQKRYKTKSGGIATALLSVSLVYDEQDNPRHFISQMMDISEKTRAVSEVKQLTKQISTILESISDAFISLDHNFRFIYTNIAAQKLFKRSNEELINQPIWDVFPWLVGSISYYECKLALEHSESRVYEQFIPKLNHWLEANVYPSDFGLSIHFRQITERKQIADKLAESEKSFRMLAENSSDVISKHDSEGILTYISPACYSLLGYRDDELIGQSPFDYIHPDDRQRIKEHRELDYQQLGDYAITYRLQHKNGAYRWFETTTSVVFLEGDRSHTMVAVSRDVTPRKEIELQLLEQYQLLHALSHVDELTKIANRRSFDEVWNNEWEEAQKHHMPLTLMIGDIDNFKAYNDNFGHQKGDDCLRQIAAALRSTLKRPLDIVARYGGEEFGIILPQTSEVRAATIAVALLKAVRELQIPHAETSGCTHVTISLGSATWNPNSSITQDELFTWADSALYQAKREGKDRYISK